jgi:hypothetical protein
LLAEELGEKFLGKIPIDPLLTEACEGGKSFIERFPQSTTLSILTSFAKSLTTP